MKKGSKRVERPGLSSEEVDEIKQAFDLFDTNGTGKIDPKELKAAMQSLGFDSKNPTIYQLIADLDTPESERNGGITFDDFVDAINDKLGDKESKEGIRRIFDLFIDDPNADTITLSSLKKISKELGENMSDEELKDMLERASKNGVELTFEDHQLPIDYSLMKDSEKVSIEMKILKKSSKRHQKIGEKCPWKKNLNISKKRKKMIPGSKKPKRPEKSLH